MSEPLIYNYSPDPQKLREGANEILKLIQEKQLSAFECELIFDICTDVIKRTQLINTRQPIEISFRKGKVAWELR